MNVMKWLEAISQMRQMDCDSALAVAMNATNDAEPLSDADASILCKDKVRAGEDDDWCDEQCPRGKR